MARKRMTPEEYVAWYESLQEMADDPEIQQDMANNDVTVIGCTRCHVRAAVASGLCAECALRAIIDDIAAHLTVEPERNKFYLKLGNVEYGACIEPEDCMDFPFMVSLRPIAALLASVQATTAEDSEQ
jgi:hypothetical protein